MATFEKRVSADGAITWRAKIRRVGAKPISKTFARKTDTTGWARDIETQHDRRYGIPTPESLKRTVTAAIDRAVPGGRRALSYAELAFPPFEHLLYVGAIRLRQERPWRIRCGVQLSEHLCQHRTFIRPLR